MRRGTGNALALAFLLGSVAGPATAAPIAALRVGDTALWEATAAPVTLVGGRRVRDYQIEVLEAGRVLRVALDHRSGGVGYQLISPSGVTYDHAGGWYTFEIFVDEPALGTWIARSYPQSDSTTNYRLRAKLEGAPASKPDPPVTMLPNLRLVPPFEFTFDPPPLGGTVVTNCSAQEVVETSASSCLRFSTGPINAGPGPLLVRFAPLEGLVTTGTAYQRVFDSDGGSTERPAGEYEYHKTHMHYHHSGFGRFELLRVIDPATGEMEPTGLGPKQGFCTGDVVMWDWEGFTQPRERTDSECVDEAASTGTNRPLGTTMGLTPGWADLYSWSQDGMYVEWSGGGDGRYVVRATADSRDWILETNENDNSSYAYIEVQGRSITVLERGLGTDPWDPAKTLVDDRQAPTR